MGPRVPALAMAQLIPDHGSGQTERDCKRHTHDTRSHHASIRNIQAHNHFTGTLGGLAGYGLSVIFTAPSSLARQPQLPAIQAFS